MLCGDCYHDYDQCRSTRDRDGNCYLRPNGNPQPNHAAHKHGGEWEMDNLTLFDILERDGRISLLNALIDAGPSGWDDPDFRHGVNYFRKGD